MFYWKKSLLTSIKGLKTKKIDELSSVSTDLAGADDSLLKTFIEAGKESNKEAAVIRYSEHAKRKTLFMDHLVLDLLESKSKDELTCEHFLSFCSQQMTPYDCSKIFKETEEQHPRANGIIYGSVESLHRKALRFQGVKMRLDR